MTVALGKKRKGPGAMVESQITAGSKQGTVDRAEGTGRTKAK